MILVTGGLGFIGAYTARALLDLGADVVVTQYRVARNPAILAGELDKRLFVEQLDVTDRDSFLALGRKYSFEGIVHLAGTGSTPHDPFEDVAANNAGLLNALLVARDWDARVSVASSVAMYANLVSTPLREDTTVTVTAGHPIEAYKKSGEITTKYVAARAGLDAVSLRIAGIYGPLYRSMTNLPSRFVHAAVKGAPVDLSPPRGPLFESDGSDLCDVRDCGRAIALLQLAPTLNYDTFNVGAGWATTAGSLRSAVQAVLPDFNVELESGHNPKGLGVATCLDLSRIAEDTGYSPAFRLEESIANYVQWLQAGNRE
jgi:UDP-glucose 4-epimerase